MGMVVNPFRFAPVAGALTGNLITNPSGAVDTTGWTQTLGAGFARSAAGVSMTGTSFIASESDLRAHVRWLQNVPNSTIEGLIDAGGVTATFSYDYDTINSDTDRARPRFMFYSGASGGGTLLGTQVFDTEMADTPTSRSHTVPVPVGTRSISVGFMAYRQSGTELSYYWNNASLILNGGGDKCVAIYVMDAHDTSGWTVTVGSFTNNLQNTNGFYGVSMLSGGNNPLLSHSKIISASADALALIATGDAVLHLSRYAFQINASDAVRTYVQCLDASDVVLATINDAASPIAWGNETISTDDKFQTYSGAVPTGTTKFRVGLDFDRNDGTASDARVGQIYVRLIV